jgi:hypothetical protein
MPNKTTGAAAVLVGTGGLLVRDDFTRYANDTAFSDYAHLEQTWSWFGSSGYQYDTGDLYAGHATIRFDVGYGFLETLIPSFASTASVTRFWMRGVWRWGTDEAFANAGPGGFTDAGPALFSYPDNSYDATLGVYATTTPGTAPGPGVSLVPGIRPSGFSWTDGTQVPALSWAQVNDGAWHDLVMLSESDGVGGTRLRTWLDGTLRVDQVLSDDLGPQTVFDWSSHIATDTGTHVSLGFAELWDATVAPDPYGLLPSGPHTTTADAVLFVRGVRATSASARLRLTALRLIAASAHLVGTRTTTATAVLLGHTGLRATSATALLAPLVAAETRTSAARATLQRAALCASAATAVLDARVTTTRPTAASAVLWVPGRLGVLVGAVLATTPAAQAAQAPQPFTTFRARSSRRR